MGIEEQDRRFSGSWESQDCGFQASKRIYGWVKAGSKEFGKRAVSYYRQTPDRSAPGGQAEQ